MPWTVERNSLGHVTVDPCWQALPGGGPGSLGGTVHLDPGTGLLTRFWTDVTHGCNLVSAGCVSPHSPLLWVVEKPGVAVM